MNAGKPNRNFFPFTDNITIVICVMYNFNWNLIRIYIIHTNRISLEVWRYTNLIWDTSGDSFVTKIHHQKWRQFRWNELKTRCSLISHTSYKRNPSVAMERDGKWCVTYLICIWNNSWWNQNFFSSIFAIKSWYLLCCFQFQWHNAAIKEKKKIYFIDCC